MFNLEKCSKAGARFNYQKLAWFNHEYILMKNDSEVAALFRPLLQEKGVDVTMERIVQAVSLVKNRVNFIHELWDNSCYLFTAPAEYDEKSLKKWWKEDSPAVISELCSFLDGESDFSAEALEPRVMDWISSKGYAVGKVMNALRVTLAGAAVGPQIFAITEFLGKEETLRRARRAISVLS